MSLMDQLVKQTVVLLIQNDSIDWSEWDCEDKWTSKIKVSFLVYVFIRYILYLYEIIFKSILYVRGGINAVH